ncbi:MAG: PilZ domain-containing protein, partial [Candidatus Eremiobacteraeota bacterium]|nr:PilZ domain-containing protein [Candidatus Eremiobacteraeota bacterium]
MSIPLPALLVDISGGGCLIASRIMVEGGQPVSYTLRRGDGKPDMKLSGVIRTKRYAESEHIYFYGVKFDPMKTADHDVLLQEISQLERRLIVHKRAEAEMPLKKPPAVALSAVGKKKAEQSRSAFRVSWPFQMTYKVPGIPGTHRATALDTSSGGMRIATDMVLRREWVLELSFTLPAQVLEVLEHHESANASELFGNRYAQKSLVVKQRPFATMTVQANVIPGVQEARGRYVHGIS